MTCWRETAVSRELAQALGQALPPGLRCAVAEVVVGSDAKSSLALHAERFPAEAELAKNAVPKRLFEFIATRTLARELLADMGHGAVSIPRGPLGAPEWPQGIVGTLAHSDGLVVVVLGSAEPYRALGIDLEPNEPLPEDVRSYVSLPGEDDRAPAARAVFVVKEAFYKAHCGVHGRMLDFSDVRVTWHNDGSNARELRPPANCTGPTSLSGTFTIAAGWLAAFCAISR